MGNLNAELLVKLTDQALLWGFCLLNLTAGEFPEPRQRFTNRSLSYENASVDVDQGGRGDQNQWFCGSLGWHAGLIARPSPAA